MNKFHNPEAPTEKGGKKDNYTLTDNSIHKLWHKKGSRPKNYWYFFHSLLKMPYLSTLYYTSYMQRLNAAQKCFNLPAYFLGYICTESKQRPPLVCVQSIWVIENLIFVIALAFSTTKSPTWYWTHLPGSFKIHWDEVCWPSEVQSWNWTGFRSQPWTCSVLHMRRPNLFAVRPNCSLKNTL